MRMRMQIVKKHANIRICECECKYSDHHYRIPFGKKVFFIIFWSDLYEAWHGCVKLNFRNILIVTIFRLSAYFFYYSFKYNFESLKVFINFKGRELRFLLHYSNHYLALNLQQIFLYAFIFEIFWKIFDFSKKIRSKLKQLI